MNILNLEAICLSSLALLPPAPKAYIWRIPVPCACSAGPAKPSPSKHSETAPAPASCVCNAFFAGDTLLCWDRLISCLVKCVSISLGVHPSPRSGCPGGLGRATWSHQGPFWVLLKEAPLSNKRAGNSELTDPGFGSPSLFRMPCG